MAFQRDGDTAVLVLPASEVSSVEWPMSRGRQTKKGLGIGLVIGVVVGGIVAAATPVEDCSVGDWICIPPEAERLFIATGGGAVGGLIGAAIGYSAHSTKWERGQPGPPRIAVAPLISPQGWGLAVSVSF